MNDTTTRGDRSGFNFWQWLGLILVVGGLALYLWNNFGSAEHDPEPTTAPADEVADEAIDE